MGVVAISTIASIGLCLAAAAAPSQQKLDPDVAHRYIACLKDCSDASKSEIEGAPEEEQQALKKKIGGSCRIKCDDEVPEMRHMTSTSSSPPRPRQRPEEKRAVADKWNKCIKDCKDEQGHYDEREASPEEKEVWYGKMKGCKQRCDTQIPEIAGLMEKSAASTPELKQAQDKWAECVESCRGGGGHHELAFLSDQERERWHVMMNKCHEQCDHAVPQVKQERIARRAASLTGADLEAELAEARNRFLSCFHACQGDRDFKSTPVSERERCRQKCEGDVPELRTLNEEFRNSQEL